MKKVLIAALALSLLLGATNLFAQANTSGITGKGIKLGLNLAKFTGSDAKNESMRTAFAGGGFITYSINDLFAIQPELFYIMKGSKVKTTILGTTHESTTKLSYIEIPVLFRVQLVGAPSFKPNFYAGPELGILLSAKFSPSGSSSDVDIKNDVKSTDFGLIGGVGADFPMGNGKLTFDIRYDIGLSSIDNTAAAAKIDNSAITFLIGYGF